MNRNREKWTVRIRYFHKKTALPLRELLKQYTRKKRRFIYWRLEIPVMLENSWLNYEQNRFVTSFCLVLELHLMWCDRLKWFHEINLPCYCISRRSSKRNDPICLVLVWFVCNRINLLRCVFLSAAYLPLFRTVSCNDCFSLFWKMMH